ncbi:hypothetical protein L210DRAFT_3571226 [Boletus edulis BED1]|uniref:C2H2-type domain-containing protein n=1 Tax=Boletus edulis BED1 TaxID=1328754 RepID=A0AAD4BDG9_BOLED|nr:hypothetical protein L210DRAFT_3571226 [Boletus edulis BED1]
MSNKTICPYCFRSFDDVHRLERHVKANHNEDEKLTLYTFGRSWRLKEEVGRFKCPLCDFLGLPWDVVVHYEQMHLVAQEETQGSGSKE